MVLIGGTTLNAEDLPLADLVEYEVVKEPVKLNMFLKTMAKSTSCVKVYLQMEQKNITLVPEVDAKVEYYNDDAELISLLQNSNDGTNIPKAIDQDEVPDEPEDNAEDPSFDDKIPDPVAELQDILETQEKVAPVVNLSKGVEDIEEGTSEAQEPPKAPELNIPSVDTDLPESFLVIPEIGDDVDKLQLALKTKDEIIKAKDATIQELKNSMDDMYSTQEKEMKDICDTYQKAVEEANETIAKLKETVTDAVSNRGSDFLKFESYAKNFKGALREGMSEEDKAEIARLSKKISIYATGAGESLFEMMKHIVKLSENRDDIVFVDFTNVNYLATKYRWRSSGSLLNEGISISDIVKTPVKASIVPGTVYNDIALLTLDWVDILRKVCEFAKGKHIIFLFGNINSFAVRYTVEKLATVGSLYVFAKASPLILTSTFSDLKFLPNNKVKLIILDYIEVVKGIVTEINKSYAITAFSKSVSWDKLGLK